MIPHIRIKDRAMNPYIAEHTTTAIVEGMTCDHCAHAVAAEVAEVPGVAHVDVDLGSGRLVVTGQEVSDAAVAAAVAEAGYEVAAAA